MNQNNKPDFIIDPTKAVFNLHAIQEQEKRLGLLIDIDCEVVETILPQKEEPCTIR